MAPIRRFLYFATHHNPHEWQWRLSSTYALSTVILFSVASLLLLMSQVLYESTYATHTLPFYAAAAFLSGVILAANRWGGQRFVGHHLIFLYICLSAVIAYNIGVGVSAMFLGSAAVILSGSMCGYWCSLLIASFNTIALLGVRTAELQGWIHPTYIVSQKPTNFQSVLLLVLLFHFLAAVSGALYRLEETRRRLSATEQAFAQSRGRLTKTIKQQNQKLRSAEAERLQQMYRFAEVGELSTALLHDLANSLTSLTFQIDTINAPNTPAMRRAKGQLKNIYEILTLSRQQLKGQIEPEVFDVAQETNHTIRLLKPAAKRAGVALEWKQSKDRLNCFGEKIVFQQQLANLINNAIDSYRDHSDKPEKRVVRIELKSNHKHMYLTVTDWGKGIPPEELDTIFRPFYTTKPGGMGVGLYLAKRFIESNLGGELTAKSSPKRTIFTVKLPVHSDEMIANK